MVLKHSKKQESSSLLTRGSMQKGNEHGLSETIIYSGAQVPNKQTSMLNTFWACFCYNSRVIEQLFGSKTRVKLLQMFYSNPNRSFYVREITRKIDEQINSVRRELANLLNVGIISSETNNNRLYYEVNQKYEYYKPLQQIFGGGVGAVVTTDEPVSAEAEEEKQTLKSLGNVELILFTGQFTRDERSGIDILIVGDVNQTQVGKYVSELEKAESKELRYATMNSEEFRYRTEVNDRFLAVVMESKHQVIADKRTKTKQKTIETGE